MKNLFIMLAFIVVITSNSNAQNRIKQKLNRIIILTNEYSLCTLECNRSIMSDGQACRFGKKTIIETSHKDQLANEDFLTHIRYVKLHDFKPSRASMIPGLYLFTYDSHYSDSPEIEGLVSSVQRLTEKGYSNSFLAQWHLNSN